MNVFTNGAITATAHMTCAACDTTLHVNISLFTASWRTLEQIEQTARPKGWDQHPVMGWVCPQHASRTAPHTPRP